MKHIKKFENDEENKDNKSELVAFIKKHITKVVALQSTFRDDDEDNFIEYSSYQSSGYEYTEYITMLDKNGVLIETFYGEGEDKNYDMDSEGQEIKYKKLDVEYLEKIKELILYGRHIDIL